MFRVIYQGRAQHLGQKMNSMKANLQMDFKMFLTIRPLMVLSNRMNSWLSPPLVEHVSRELAHMFRIMMRASWWLRECIKNT